ncbi:MAG: 30S ribosomal protein S5 [Verrucomicrobiota bacterium]|nr:30S ribosomal protein S5 [Verrucomicrobiota bacterium]
MANNRSNNFDAFEETVVSINRSSKVVKGGRNFSFSALVVAGDRNGKVGIGFGKANEVADAIRKGSALARTEMIDIPLSGRTIYHTMEAKFRGAHVFMKPASEGTGLIAGGGVRAVLDLVGVRDVLTKSMGSNNPINVVKATIKALKNIHSKDEIFEKRGLKTKK